MKVYNKLMVVIVAVGIFLLQRNMVYATEAFTIYNTEQFGVDSIKIPEEYAVITRSVSYNTSSLEDYGVDLNSIQQKLNNSNTYICAMSYDFDHEINIDFSEGEYALDVADLKDFSSDEIMEIFESNESSEIENLKVSYADVGDNATILMSGYITDSDQYLVQYVCTSTASDKNYLVLFKLYSYGIAPTTSMKNNLTSIVRNCSIVSPESVVSYGMSEEEAKKAATRDFMSDVIETFLGGVIRGGVLGLLVLLIVRMKRKKNKKEASIQASDEYNTGNVVASDLLNAQVIKEPVNVDNEESIKEVVNIKEDLKFQGKKTNRLYCRKCGYELPTDSEFCNKCGTKVIR